MWHYIWIIPSPPRTKTTNRKLRMNKILLLALTAMIFTGCQVSIVRPSKGSVAVYQGFSRSAVGEGNKVKADSTKTSAILTASVNPELNSEINPSISSEVNPALSSEINPSLASEINPSVSAEINPEIATELSPELEVSDLSDVATGGSEPISTNDETGEETETDE